MTLHPQAIARASEIKAIHGIAFRELSKPDRRRKIMEARRHFWWLLVRLGGFSLPRAARVTGHHHTTVLYGIRQHEARSVSIPAQEKAA